MLDLNDVYCFVQVVDRGGYTAAGKALGLPKSTLSRRVLNLESQLGVRLIQRTSRSLSVTDVGREFYRHALGMRIEAEAAENAVKRRLADPSGIVRFTCSVGMAPRLADVLVRFLVRFPRVSLVQHATNRFVDLVEEGFDVGIRGYSEPLPDSNLIQRPLMRTPWYLFAAATYLERRGVPASPVDLAGHDGLALSGSGDEAVWKLRSASGQQSIVPFAPRLRSDNMETLRLAAIAGLGIVGLPGYLCRADVERGALQRVLADWGAGDAGITLLMPTRRGLLPSVRAFVDFIVAEYPPTVAGAPQSTLAMQDSA